MLKKVTTERAGAALLVLIMIAGVFLRFYQLGGRPLYGDEPFHTVVWAAKSPADILSVNSGSILYTLLVHVLLPLGKMEVMARLPAALFGSLGVWLVFLVGRLLFRRREAILAAFLAATSTYLIFFAQQARAYSGLLCFSLASLYFFLRALRGDRARDWIFYALSTSLAVGLHFFSLVVVPVHVLAGLLFWLLRKRDSDAPDVFDVTAGKLFHLALGLAATAALIFAFYAPSRAQQGNENFFLELSHSLRSLLHGALTIEPLSLTADIVMKQLEYAVAPAYFFLKLGLMAVGLVAGLLANRKTAIFLLLGLSVPIALFVLSDPPAIYLPVDNKFIFLLPFLILLIARGVTALGESAVAVAAKVGVRAGGRPAELGVIAALSLLLLAGAGRMLEIQRSWVWAIHSLYVDREVRSYLAGHVDENEMLFADSTEALLNFLPLWPIASSSGKPLLILNELGDNNQRSTPLTPTGLWVVLHAPEVDRAALATWEREGLPARIVRFSSGTLIHFPRSDLPLWRSLVRAIDLARTRSRDAEEDLAYRLFLIKVYLLSSENAHALELLKAFGERELQTVERRHAPIPAYLLVEDIVRLLAENGVAALEGGRADEAAALFGNAEALVPADSALQGQVIFREAEALARGNARIKAARRYAQLLPFCAAPREEDYVLQRIGELNALPYGYIVWRAGNEWHIRWRSDSPRRFSGTVELARSPVRWKTYRTDRGDRIDRKGPAFAFSASTGDALWKGWDFRVAKAGPIRLDLDISGESDVVSKIFIVDKGGPPAGDPFVLE